MVDGGLARPPSDGDVATLTPPPGDGTGTATPPAPAPPGSACGGEHASSVVTALADESSSEQNCSSSGPGASDAGASEASGDAAGPPPGEPWLLGAVLDVLGAADRGRLTGEALAAKVAAYARFLRPGAPGDADADAKAAVRALRCVRALVEDVDVDVEDDDEEEDEDEARHRLAADGDFDAVEARWGEAAAKSARAEAWRASASLPFTSKLFELAREGRFGEMDAQPRGAECRSTLLAWCALKSDDWSAARRKRSAALDDRATRTVASSLGAMHPEKTRALLKSSNGFAGDVRQAAGDAAGAARSSVSRAFEDDEPDSDGFDGYLDELRDRSSDDDSDGEALGAACDAAAGALRFRRRFVGAEATPQRKAPHAALEAWFLELSRDASGLARAAPADHGAPAFADDVPLRVDAERVEALRRVGASVAAAARATADVARLRAAAARRARDLVALGVPDRVVAGDRLDRLLPGEPAAAVPADQSSRGRVRRKKKLESSSDSDDDDRVEVKRHRPKASSTPRAAPASNQSGSDGKSGSGGTRPLKGPGRLDDSAAEMRERLAAFVATEVPTGPFEVTDDEVRTSSRSYRAPFSKRPELRLNPAADLRPPVLPGPTARDYVNRAKRAAAHPPPAKKGKKAKRARGPTRRPLSTSDARRSMHDVPEMAPFPLPADFGGSPSGGKRSPGNRSSSGSARSPAAAPGDGAKAFDHRYGVSTDFVPWAEIEAHIEAGVATQFAGGAFSPRSSPYVTSSPSGGFSPLDPPSRGRGGRKSPHGARTPRASSSKSPKSKAPKAAAAPPPLSLDGAPESPRPTLAGGRGRPPPVLVAEPADRAPPPKVALLAPRVVRLEDAYGAPEPDDEAAANLARARADFDLDPDAMLARHDVVLKDMKRRIDALVAEVKAARALASPRRSGSFSHHK